MSRLTIYYGQISYIPRHPGQDEMFEREPILDAVYAARSVKRYGHEWVLGNLNTDDLLGLITGRLGYPEREHRTQQDYDVAEHRFVEQEYDLPDAVSAAFALDYTSGEIAFEGDEIGPTGFINHFVALLNQGKEPRFKGALARFATTYREFVGTVEKVTRVTFDVRPTNPRDREIFRPLDEGMKAANAKRQRVVVENQEEGLTLHPPDSVDEANPNPAVQGIEMNEEGYGEGYRIDATKDGEPVRFDSTAGGSLVSTVLSASDDPDERAKEVEGAFLARLDTLNKPADSPVQPLEPPSDEDDTARDAPEPETPDLDKPIAELEPPADDSPEDE